MEQTPKIMQSKLQATYMASKHNPQERDFISNTSLVMWGKSTTECYED